MLKRTITNRIIISLIIITILIYNYFKSYKFKSPKTQYIEKTNSKNLECNNEWLLLNDDVFFRRNLAFYYTDLKLIKLYYERRSTYNNMQIKLLIKYKTTIKNSKKLIINEVNSTKIVYKSIRNDFAYNFESLETNIDTLITNIETINSIQVFIQTKDNEFKTKEPLDLAIKPYNRLHQTNKNNIMLCSDIKRFLNKDYFTSFKYWVEIHKLNGYEKLTIYNNSIENSAQYNELFNENKNFLELIQFKCIPNFFEPENKSRLFLDSYTEVLLMNNNKSRHSVYNHRFEIFIYTECYLMNKEKYKYIEISDQDELIIIPNNTELKMANYLENLKKKLNLNPTTSFHFKSGQYLKFQTLKIFFQSIESSLLNSVKTFPYSLRIKDDTDYVILNYVKYKLDFKIIIRNETEVDYAKKLLKFYNLTQKLFQNQSLSLGLNRFNQKSEQFNRLFYYFSDESWKKNGGKTIHDTLITHDKLTHHWPVPANPITIIDHQYTHEAHFRKEYNLDLNDKSILDFYFDLNYFNFYYLPTLKNLNFIQ